jgi:hypothetical protein
LQIKHAIFGDDDEAPARRIEVNNDREHHSDQHREDGG